MNLSFEAYIRNMFGLTGLEKDYKFARVDPNRSPKLHHSRISLLDRFTMMLEGVDEWGQPEHAKNPEQQRTTGPPRVGFAAEASMVMKGARRVDVTDSTVTEHPCVTEFKKLGFLVPQWEFPSPPDPPLHRPYTVRSALGLRRVAWTRVRDVLPVPEREEIGFGLVWVSWKHEMLAAGDARYANLYLGPDTYDREDLHAKLDLYGYGYGVEHAKVLAEGYPSIDGKDIDGGEFLPVTTADTHLLHFLQPKAAAEKTKHALWRAQRDLREIQGRLRNTADIPQGSGEANPRDQERDSSVFHIAWVLQPTRPSRPLESVYKDLVTSQAAMIDDVEIEFVEKKEPTASGWSEYFQAALSPEDFAHLVNSPQLTHVRGAVKAAHRNGVWLSPRQKRDRRCADLQLDVPEPKAEKAR
jgi:hypothetical protein